LPAVGGTVAPGLEAVALAFEANLGHRGELGAAFAAVADGHPVVDLWAGEGRHQGLAALCLLMLVERGRLDLDAPVRRYWPKFAAAGKERVPVRQVVSHQAACRPAGAAGHADLADDVRMAAPLAAQAQEGDRRAARARAPGGRADLQTVRRASGRGAPVELAA
jgi:CubicO group peptidase (beta-lactamase class C family)